MTSQQAVKVLKHYAGLIPLGAFLWFYFGATASLCCVASYLFGHFYTMFTLYTVFARLAHENNFLRAAKLGEEIGDDGWVKKGATLAPDTVNPNRVGPTRSGR